MQINIDLPQMAGAVRKLIHDKSDDEEKIGEQIKDLLAGLKDQERRKVIKLLRKEMIKDIRQSEKSRATLEDELVKIKGMKASYEEVENWAKSGNFKLERPTGSHLHHLRQDILCGAAHVYHKRKGHSPPDDYESVFAESHVFLVEHDWGAAFANAGEYAEGWEYHLPFEVCVFEFKVNGRQVILAAMNDGYQTVFEVMAKASVGWFVLGQAMDLDDIDPDKNTNGWTRLICFLAPQVKAICVALEAEVAETNCVRAPHKLNHAREKLGRPPLSDYHLLSIANRRRSIARLADGGEPQSRKRLHFRRGHWRHFETFKTWVRWTLVGDPDLGFVDKDYRL